MFIEIPRTHLFLIAWFVLFLGPMATYCQADAQCADRVRNEADFHQFYGRLNWYFNPAPMGVKVSPEGILKTVQRVSGAIVTNPDYFQGKEQVFLFHATAKSGFEIRGFLDLSGEFFVQAYFSEDNYLTLSQVEDVAKSMGNHVQFEYFGGTQDSKTGFARFLSIAEHPEKLNLAAIDSFLEELLTQ